MKRFLAFSAPVCLAAAFISFLAVSQQRRLASVDTAAPTPFQSPRAQAFLLLFGHKDKRPRNWNGRIRLVGGQIMELQGYHFERGDRIEGTTWRVRSRRIRGARRRRQRAVRPAGIIVLAQIQSADARFIVRVQRRRFAFRPSRLPWGKRRYFLKGAVSVERIPTPFQLTTSYDEQDFPAVGRAGHDVYVAYVQFTHTMRELERQRNFTEPPEDFDFLANPPGGDQVLLMHYSIPTRIWKGPYVVSEPQRDVMGVAVAVAGDGRAWVIWSENTDGNFEIYARSFRNGRFSRTVRLTNYPGSDIFPVATTDSEGRVWVAWQAFRNQNLEIMATVFDGERFLPEVIVSTSNYNDWAPSIAAGQNGDVAISWDTYEKGDYDVYFRTLRFDGTTIQLDSPIPVATSYRFEARSSIAFDSSDRIWVAYETAPEKWGKDFGAYETTGVPLYLDHNVELKCFQGDRVCTAPGLDEVLPAPVPIRNRETTPEQLQLPDPTLAERRQPNRTPALPATRRNSFPRLLIDDSDTIYLAYRRPVPRERSRAGTVWQQEVVFYDGERWQGPILVARSDTRLEHRPGLVSLAPGNLMMITVSDHRFSPILFEDGFRPESINTDLFAQFLVTPTARRQLNLIDLPPETPLAADEDARAERRQIQLFHNHTLQVRGQTLRPMRGEFHRHTEFSGDGGRDGPLIDAYRYLIDAAGMDWGGCCDHDNGGGREYFWWLEQKYTDAFNLAPRYVSVFSYERSVRYPEGHRNVIFIERGIRPLGRLPKTAEDSPPEPAPDTQMLYRYLKHFNGIAASHTSATNMGTDWRDNDPEVEPVVEIYQGDRQNYEMPGAPRSNSESDSIGGWRPLGFISNALLKGYRLAFQSSSDHISTHMSYGVLWVREPTREAVLEAFKKRRVYGATDNILAEFRCGDHFMGEEFSLRGSPEFYIKLIGTAPFARVHIIKNNRYVYTIEPNQQVVEFTWRDQEAERGEVNYYYVRGEQQDGELVWVSPMWVHIE